MEQISLWVTIFIGIIIPFVGWIFNSLITNKINDVVSKQKEDKELFFKRLDSVKDEVENNYVRKDLYDQATKFNTEHTDEKFKSLLTIMTTQFSNVEDKIEELKKILNDKLTHTKQGG